jgi:hypothetical protein
MTVFPTQVNEGHADKARDILLRLLAVLRKNYRETLERERAKDNNDKGRTGKTDPENETPPDIRWKISRDGKPLYDSGAGASNASGAVAESSDNAIDVEWVETLSRVVNTEDPATREPDLANTTVEATVMENGKEIERRRIIVVDESGEIYDLFKGDDPDNRRKAADIATGNNGKATDGTVTLSGALMDDVETVTPPLAEANTRQPPETDFNTEMDGVLDLYLASDDGGAILEVYRDGKTIYSELQGIDETNGRLMGQLEILRSLPIASLAGERAANLQVVSVRGEGRETVFQTDGEGRVIANRPYTPEGTTAGLDVVSEYFKESAEPIAGYIRQLSEEMKETRETVQRLSEDNEKLHRLLLARQREENLRVTDWWQKLTSYPKQWAEAAENRKAARTVLEIFKRETFPGATHYGASGYTITVGAPLATAREGNAYTLSDRDGKEYLKFETTPANQIKVRSATLDRSLLDKLADARKAMRSGGELPAPLATGSVLAESRSRRAAAIAKSLLAIAAAQPGGRFESSGSDRFNIAADSNTGRVSLFSIADGRGEVFRRSIEGGGTVVTNRMTEDDMEFVEGRIANFEGQWRENQVLLESREAESAAESEGIVRRHGR